jgi:hypothetical protein
MDELLKMSENFRKFAQAQMAPQKVNIEKQMGTPDKPVLSNVMYNIQQLNATYKELSKYLNFVGKKLTDYDNRLKKLETTEPVTTPSTP